MPIPMSVMQIIKFIRRMNPNIHYSMVHKMNLYFWRMMTNKRILMVWENRHPIAMICFSITNDTTKFQNKDIWKYLEHKPDGLICYVEKLIAKKWNKDIRNQLVSMGLSEFPQIKYVVFDRPAKEGNREVSIKLKEKQYV